MNSLDLQQLVEGFQEVAYPKVTRNLDSYEQTHVFIEREVNRLLGMYRALTAVDQTARLIRDIIDLLLRRYHGYSIEGHIGSHYRQAGADAAVCDFEHVIPQSKIRDMLIQGRLTTWQAMNPPTCLIHKDLHKDLKEQGLASKTPSPWNFWKRYKSLDIQIETHNGQPVDTASWNLGEHYRYFGIA
jgi:hypothetical protein